MGRKTAILAAVVASWFGSIRAEPVIINEIHYAPGDKTVPEEYVELFNNSGAAVDVSGWYFSNGISFTIPVGTSIEPFGYLVVAQDPATLTDLYGAFPVVGPFEGRISNQGEEIRLRNADGGREDAVDFQRGFPWPTVGGRESFSIELVHPDLDNDLGGSWRSADPDASTSGQLISAGASWRYRKGTSAPPAGWRAIDFADGGWSTGTAPIGYGEDFVETTLADMRNGYSTVYLRREFQLDDLADASSLTLEVLYDDGFNVWINGTHVADGNLDNESLPYDGTADGTREDHGFIDYRLVSPSAYLVEGTNVVAVQLANASIGGSSDAFIDLRLIGGAGGGSGPTPGARNSTWAESAPPQLRQVQHFPESPVGGEEVIVTVKVTDPDGVDSVALEYQLVDPGSYVRLSDGAYQSGWTPLPMLDDGEGFDVDGGDDVYTVLLPRGLQTHRRLVRYRILATDTTGQSVLVPYSDDPQPNFAYFVYDGIPSWRGASRPGSTSVQQFSEEVMRQLPAYHLIARDPDVINSQYNSGSRGVHFLGTLVYDGVVYDHIEFENRGEFSTYVSGKNKWRLHFNRGHAFQARDDYGRKYRTKWERMNLGTCATPWVPTNRGMAGLGETIAFKLYELAGNPSSKTNYFQLRIIDESVEAHSTDQYRGDLWGLYFAIEHTDGAFLDERDLPDGNTYKIERGGGDKRNQGPTQSRNASDYNALKSGYSGSRPISWWRDNVDLFGYYNFRAVNRAVNNMDLREGWNIAQYHNPETGQWTVLAWDLDMLYMPLTHWSGIMNFQNCLSQHQTLLIEYRNRCRQLQDLLFTDDQFGPLVLNYLSFVSPSGQPLTWSDVDKAMWNYHPRTSGNHRGAFYRNPSTHGARGGSITRTLVSADHAGMAQWIYDFVIEGYGASQLEAHERDTAIPRLPTIASIGAAGFPIDDLRFRSSAFSDPQGSGTFRAMEWRVGEVSGDDRPAFDPASPPPFEIAAVWESEEISPFESDITVPAGVVKVGGKYRVRVRMEDSTSRWSHWSDPIEFTAGAPATPFPQQDALRVTELHYHPAEGSDLEFIELRNVSGQLIDLTPISLTDGIEFDFVDSDITDLGPGEYILIVNNRVAFETFYGPDLPIGGEYGGRLSNAGEHVTLTYGANTAILDFDFVDDWYPLTDGGGRSLHIIDDLDAPSTWGDPASWTASSQDGGSPGTRDGGGPIGGRQLPGDSNQDGLVDVSDAVHLVRRLFLDGGLPLPCDGDALDDGGNLVVLDANANARVEIGDVVYVLEFLFREGPTPGAVTRCIRIEGCPSACGF
jgi:hypothetical protein